MVHKSLSEINITLFSLCSSNPIEFNKWVLPNPTPPQIYRGYSEINVHKLF